jgi:hypothetical protein
MGCVLCDVDGTVVKHETVDRKSKRLDNLSNLLAIVRQEEADSCYNLFYCGTRAFAYFYLDERQQLVLRVF